jgi:signal transduction histidine kinase
MSSELELLERMWDPEEARASLPVLRDQVRRISSLLRELVDFGRGPSEDAAPFDPVVVLEEVARLLRHDPRSRGVDIVVDGGSEAHELCSSRDRLVQVLVNLGINALDAMEGNGSLVFRLVAQADEGVRIDVEDTGPGVSDELADQVFDPFFTTKPPGAGTGLGLFVSERLARELGGRLELVPGGAGATFAVHVPPCERNAGSGGSDV